MPFEPGDIHAFVQDLGLQPWVFIAAGIGLVLWGAYNIVKKSISLVIWMILLMLGTSVALYGLGQKDPALAEKWSNRVSGNILEPGKKMSMEAAQKFCADLEKKKEEGFSDQTMQYPQNF
ncbi:hypothetical protein ACQZV8_14675 [Magnetococcales bacterium HHB-1]